jgi:hypothetical protein
MNTSPLLACCNFIPEVEQLRQFALDLGFKGIDWTFTPENLPEGPTGEAELARVLSRLHPLEIRYHLAFQGMDLGDENQGEPQRALPGISGGLPSPLEVEGSGCHYPRGRPGPGVQL